MSRTNDVDPRRTVVVPQASDLQRLETVLELAALGLLETSDIAARLRVEEETARYYLQLVSWLDFLDDDARDLTELGRRFVGQIESRREIMRRALRARPLVRAVLGHDDWPKNPESAASSVIEQWTDLPEATVRRRARSFVRLLDRVSIRAGWRGEGTSTAESDSSWDSARYQRLTRQLDDADRSIDEHWREVLVDLPTRAITALERAEIESVRELIAAATSEQLTELAGIGASTASEIRDQMATIAERGYDVYLYGPGGKPETITELADRMLNGLDEEDRHLLELRYRDGETFSDIGKRFGLTRQRIRQKASEQLEAFRKHYLKVAEDLVGRLHRDLEEGAGLVHRERVEARTGCADLYRVVLTLVLLDEGAYIWRDHFIANRPSTKIDRQSLAELRRSITESNRLTVPIRESVRFARSDGIQVGFEGVRDIVGIAWDIGIDRQAEFENPWARKADRIAEVLVDARRPLSLDKIAQRYAADYATDEEATPTARRVQPFVKKHPRLYTVENGVYVHEISLPVDVRRLEEVVDWCVERLRGETSPVSVNVLLEELRASEFPADHVREVLNRYLLRDVLLRRPGVIGFHNTFNVAWRESYEEGGTTLLDRVERILAEADEPLSAEQIVEKLPENFEVNVHSVENYLVSEPFSIRVSDNRHVHRDRLGLSDSELERLCDTAVDLLPTDGSVMSTPEVVDRIADEPGCGEFAPRERAAAELWGLLRHDGRVRTNRHLLVARKTDGDEELLERAILGVLETFGPAYPREIDEQLEERFGFDISDSRVYRRVRELTDRNDLGRFSTGLYYLAEDDESRLFELFRKRDHELLRLAQGGNLQEFDSDELFLLARYLREAGHPSAALDALDELISRGGHPKRVDEWKKLSHEIDRQLGPSERESRK